jgi:hypothetical protein
VKYGWRKISRENLLADETYVYYVYAKKME